MYRYVIVLLLVLSSFWSLTFAMMKPELLENNHFGYIGQPISNISQSIWLGGYRLYQPQSGTFSKSDSDTPFDTTRTFNGYNYANGNPLLMADSSGHDSSQTIMNVSSGLLATIVSGGLSVGLTEGFLRLGMRPIFAAFVTSGAISGATGGLIYQTFARQRDAHSLGNFIASAGIGMAITLPLSAAAPFMLYPFKALGQASFNAGAELLKNKNASYYRAYLQDPPNSGALQNLFKCSLKFDGGFTSSKEALFKAAEQAGKDKATDTINRIQPNIDSYPIEL